MLLSTDDVWCSANGNFLDVSVLEWCKLFGEPNGKHHWRRAVQNPNAFLFDLKKRVGVSEEEFIRHCHEVKTYRDKFVAHLDTERKMQIPHLEMNIQSTIFLYELIRAEFAEFLPDAPHDLRDFYGQRFKDGRKFYQNAP